MEELGDIGLNSTNISAVDIQIKFDIVKQSFAQGNEKLTSISLPNVSNYDWYSFCGCVNLRELTAPCASILLENIFKQNGKKINSLQNLVISEGTEILGDNLLSGFSQLTSVSFPNSLTSLGSNVFNGCTNIYSLNFGRNVNYTNNTFSGLSSLEILTIPYINTIISNDIKNLSSLNSLCILHHNCDFSLNSQFTNSKVNQFYFENNGEHISSINTGALSGLSNIIELNLSNSNIKELNTGTFKSCGSLTTIYFPNTLSSLEEECFEKCYNLTFDNSTFPQNVKELYKNLDIVIELSSFLSNILCIHKQAGTKIKINNGSNLLEISNNVDIQQSAFINNNNIQGISFNDGIYNNKINDSAFENCINLISVLIDSSNKINIDKNSFKNTQSLEYFNFNYISSVDASAFYESKFSTTVDLTCVEKIGDYAFQNCKFNNLLLGYNLFNDENNIGTKIFNNCSKINLINALISQNQLCAIIDGTYISDPSDIESIRQAYNKIKDFFGIQSDFTFKTSDMTYSKTGEMTYACLEYDPTYTILLSVKNECDLTSLAKNNFKLPDFTQYISSNAFDYVNTKYGLNCVIGSNVLSIADNVFSNNNNLLSVYFPKLSKTGIKQFYNNTKLSSLQLSSLQIISPSSFYNCSNISEIDLKNISEIGENAFYNCSNISEIDLKNISEIGENAFYNCSKLTSIQFENLYEIKLIEFKSNFIYGTKISSIIIPPSITSLNNNSLSGLTNNLSIFLHDKYKDNIGNLNLTNNHFKSSIGTKFFTKDNNYTHQTFITKSLNEVKEINNNWFDCYVNNNKIHLNGVDTTGYNFKKNLHKEDFININYIDKSAFNEKLDIYSVQFDNEMVYNIEPLTFENCKDLETIQFNDLDFNQSQHMKLLSTFVGSKQTNVKMFFKEGYVCYNYDKYEGTYYEYHKFNESIQFFIKEKFASKKYAVIGTRYDCPRDQHTSVDSDCYILSSKSLMNTYDVVDLSTNNISSICDYVFLDNANLSSITLNSNIKYISDNAFTKSYIKKINIPSSLLCVDGYGLNQSYSLKDLHYDEGIKEINASAMINNWSLLTNIYFPTTLSVIKDYAFAETIDQFPRLQNINFEHAVSLLSIGNYAFYNSIQTLNNNILKFPTNLLSIGNYSFGYRRDTYSHKLSSLVLSDDGIATNMRNIKYIGLSAFIYNKFKNISFNNKIKIIDEYAFAYPYRQFNILIPNSIEHINRNAFKNNIILNPEYTLDNIIKIDKQIEDLYYNDSESNNPIIDIHLDDKNEAENYLGMSEYTCISALKSNYISGFVFIHHDKMCFCPKNSYIDVINKIYIKCDKNAKEIYVPEYIKTISAQAFMGAIELTSISANNSINIQESAFYDCSSLIYINDKNLYYDLIDVKDYEFYNCQNLKNVSLTLDTKNIGNYSFYNCKKITNLYKYSDLSNIQYFQLSSIGNNAFENCYNLSVFDICKNIKYLGNNAFDNCSSLNNINIYLADYEFRDIIDSTKSISSVIIDKFYSVRSDFKCRLNFNNSVYTNDGYPKIDNEFIKIRQYSENGINKTALCALQYNYFIESSQDYLNLSAIDKVDSFVFIDCEKLKSISFLPLISESENRELDIIGDYAFYNCINMTNINNSRLYCSSIGKYAFGNCQLLIEMTFDYNKIKNISQGCFYGTSLNTLIFENCEDISQSREHILNVCNYKKGKNENPMELPEYCIIIFKDNNGNIIEKCDYLFNSLLYSTIDVNKNQVVYIDKAKDSIKPVLIIQQDDFGRLPAILANTYNVNIVGRWK